MTIKQNTCGRLFLAGLVAALIPGMSLAAPDEDALQACRAIENNAERLACYDAAYSAATPQPVEPPAEAPAAVAPQAEAPSTVMPPRTETESQAADAPPVPLDDDVGRESIDSGVDKDLVIQGHVVRCEVNRRGRYHFFFDNGQVWRQQDNTRIPWKECEFDVEIRKDFFGYKMQPVGMDRKVRISRMK